MKTHAISKDSVSLISVAEHEAGQRLDNYLIKILKGVPKSHIHRIIRAGEVRLNKKREARYLELVHRLDKDTSGLLMIAKKRSALVRLHEAIRNDRPKKIYLALGVGRLENDRFHVKLPLFKYTGAQGEKMVRVSEDGQSAHTVFRVLNRFSDGLLHQAGLSHLTLVEATLKTGRTHQIRVHLQSQHCPIAGDERYGDYQANKRLQKLGLKRMFLHASELHLDHPLTGEPLHLKADLPQELWQFTVMLENRHDAV